MTPAVELTDLLPPDHLERSLRADARAGLLATPKSLPPKWFYDKIGSELFEQITELPEYYPTRAEREILESRAGDIARASRSHTLVELGSGSSRKTRLLLDALHRLGTLERYVAVDVSASALLQAGQGLTRDYPDLAVHAVVADFESQLPVVPAHDHRLIGFLGGTIGNFEPDARALFLGQIRAMVAAGDYFMVGTDLVKPVDALVRAYDDTAGVTAEFNKNVLRVLNRALGANFDPDGFDHVARWNAEHRWIEMVLRARRDMVVVLPALDDLRIGFAAGEEMRTEISAKFELGGVRAELADAGFATVRQWTDAAGWFAVTLAEPVDASR